MQSTLILQERNSALINDLKFLKSENTGLHATVETLKNQLLNLTAKCETATEENALMVKETTALRNQIA